MLYFCLLAFTALIGGYFTFQYIALIRAIDRITSDMNDIRQDLTQNQMLHLPLPDRHLRGLLCAFNSLLEEIQKERQNYEKREQRFKKEIENISHDLRTPLTVILGYLKLFKKSGERPFSDNTDFSETLCIVEQKAETLKQLIEQFYDYSRLNAGDYELTLAPVDVSRRLRETLAGNSRLLEQAGLKITAELPDYPLWVAGEEAAFDRIFFNLLQNAARYAKSWLKIEVKEQKETLSLLFTNDTEALSRSDISHLFERFYMQDRSRSRGGTGLGLTIAKALAEEMNGSLLIKLPEDTGNSKEENLIVCFELCLPPYRI